MNEETRNSQRPAPTPDPTEEKQVRARLNRRHFLLAGAASGLAAGATALSARSLQAAGAPQAASPAATTGDERMAMPTPAPVASPAQDGFTHFVPAQAAVIAAAAARLIPTDENGPGATEAGVVYFIDRQLSSEYGLRGREYRLGPFQQGASTQGDQSALSMRDRYRLGIEGMNAYAQQLYGKGFAELAPEEQDRILSDMEAGLPDGFGAASIQAMSTEAAGAGTETSVQRVRAGGMGIGARAFFELLRAHTIAGFFADPVHGGNRDMVGWKLIGFPGAQTSYRAHISSYGVPFSGPFISLADYQQAFTGGS